MAAYTNDTDIMISWVDRLKDFRGMKLNALDSVWVCVCVCVFFERKSRIFSSLFFHKKTEINLYKFDILLISKQILKFSL
jgi:hypothetical protein